MPNSPATPGSTEPRRTILLAEDNVATAEMTAEVISHFGYNVVVARDGLEAITCARQHQPSLILMDVQMPNMDGLTATRALKQDPATAGIPVICLTALAMEKEAARSREAGAVLHLSKPVDFDRLAQLLAQYTSEPARKLPPPV